MKTTKRDQSNLPPTVKAGAYIFLVAVIPFFGRYLLNASDPEDNTASFSEARDAIALLEESETPIKLEEWMISTTEDTMDENPESEIELESWMITPEDLKDNNEYISFTNFTLHIMNLK